MASSVRGEPWCLCHNRLYQIAIRNNPFIANRFWRLGWLDPEDWLAWWHFAVPVRIYFKTKPDWKWINFPFLAWRDDQVWENPVPTGRLNWLRCSECGNNIDRHTTQTWHQGIQLDQVEDKSITLYQWHHNDCCGGG